MLFHWLRLRRLLQFPGLVTIWKLSFVLNCRSSFFFELYIIVLVFWFASINCACILLFCFVVRLILRDVWIRLWENRILYFRIIDFAFRNTHFFFKRLSCWSFILFTWISTTNIRYCMSESLLLRFLLKSWYIRFSMLLTYSSSLSEFRWQMNSRWIDCSDSCTAFGA